MASQPTTRPYDWTSTRGAKWRKHLAPTEATLAPLNEPLLQALQLDAPYRVADIGCGGGDTSIEIARRAPPGSTVLGVDISSALIEAAEQRARSVAANGLAFQLADVAVAPPPRPAYDRLVSRFGVMFFDDPLAAFKRLHSWLAPGGRCVFAVWGPPADNPWMSMVRGAVAEVVELPAPVPDAPGPFRYADVEAFMALLRGAGLRNLAVKQWRGSLPVGGGLSAERAAAYSLAAHGHFHEMLTGAGPEAYAAAERALVARFRAHERAGEVWAGACVSFVSGQ